MQGEVRRLKQVFNSFMEIPIYQRNYDWKISQCERLFDDLLYAGENELENHFFGSIVRQVGSNEVSQIIDGQQRITTVSLLVSAIANAASHGEIEVSSERQIRQIRHQFLFDEDEETRRKIYLKPVKKDTEAFDSIVYDKPLPSTAQDSNIAKNYEYLYDRVVKCGLSLGELVELVKKLEVMDLKLAPSDDAQLIFESLNSTGLALSESDKVRNYLLMNLSPEEQQRCYNEYWLKIEEYTQLEDSDSADIATTSLFIRDYITIKLGRICRKDSIYEEFKGMCEREPKSRPERLSEMRTYARANYNILKAEDEDKNVRRKLKELSTLESRQPMPFLMPLFADADREGLSNVAKVEIINIIESYLARRIVCSKPSNALNKVFCTLHSDIKKKVHKPEGDASGTEEATYADALKYVLLSKQGSSAFPNDDEVKCALATRNIYGLLSETRAFLFDRLENGDDKEYIDIVGDIRDGKTSIEHIMPQSLDDEWKKALGDNWDDVHNKYLHTLANLTLTGYNSEYSNRQFIEKRDGTMSPEGETLGGFRTSHYRLSETLKDLGQWTENEILERQKWVTDRFLKIFPQIRTNLTKAQSNVFTLADGGEALTGKNLIGYRLFGVDCQCNSWKDMLVSICKDLYERNTDAIKVECAKNYRIMHSNDNTLRPVKIADKCYVDTNNSTSDKIKGLQRLFKVCGIEQEELELYVKPDKNE
ncbi:MAG: DUF262 domain-containing protein [Marinilabiliaceae bacterium]